MIYKCTFIRSFTFLSPFFISPSLILNFQFSILNSQKAGVFLPIRAGFPAKDAGFFFFLYLPFQIK